ncbi:transmembrane protein 70, mitochondrial [Erpetoichthys calabaricus]|uniref:transmembrane protein 70, mitochondrial n=1 Tax=Erpetoichthys calabaricus TaxID=27687 RepID=UPI002234859D|nr:transmembrane protein 70, mitochondrial [Erpetoichthys calabaricus]
MLRLILRSTDRLFARRLICSGNLLNRRSVLSGRPVETAGWTLLTGRSGAHEGQVTVSTSSRCFSVSSRRNEENKLIYKGNLAKAIIRVKFFSYSSSMFSICVAPYLFLKTGIGVDSLALQVVFCGIIGFFTFMTPVLLHMITKGYVVRLYHNPRTDIYTAVTYSALLSEKKTAFHQKDVQVPDVSKMFTSFYAKKKSMLVNPMLFEVPSDYNHLMGFDKPFLFDLEELQFQDKRKEE